MNKNHQSILMYFKSVPNPLNLDDSVRYTVNSATLDGSKLWLNLGEHGDIWVQLPKDVPAELDKVISALVNTEIVDDLIKADIAKHDAVHKRQSVAVEAAKAKVQMDIALQRAQAEAQALVNTMLSEDDEQPVVETIEQRLNERVAKELKLKLDERAINRATKKLKEWLWE